MPRNSRHRGGGRLGRPCDGGNGLRHSFGGEHPCGRQAECCRLVAAPVVDLEWTLNGVVSFARIRMARPSGCSMSNAAVLRTRSLSGEIQCRCLQISLTPQRLQNPPWIT